MRSASGVAAPPSDRYVSAKFPNRQLADRSTILGVSPHSSFRKCALGGGALGEVSRLLNEVRGLKVGKNLMLSIRE